MKTLFFLFVSFSLTAQIRGVVKDSISGEPIPFVNIWVENETVGTTSEADGTFFLQASKEKNIVISVLGYERKTLKGSEISEVFSILIFLNISYLLFSYLAFKNMMF